MDGAIQTADAVFDAATVAARLRNAWAEALCHAISECHPQDAAQIMVAALEDMVGEGPQADAFGTLRGDAQWWAETAPQHELQEYTYAGMKQLGQRALGPGARKRLILTLWQGLTPADKRAFIAKVAP